MKYVRNFESFNYNQVNEGIIGDWWDRVKNLWGNWISGGLKQGADKFSEFVEKNPEQFEKLKQECQPELDKLSDSDIDELSQKLEEFSGENPPQDLIDATDEVVSEELKESNKVIPNAFRYMGAKLLDFIGASSRVIGVITIIVNFIVINCFNMHMANSPGVDFSSWGFTPLLAYIGFFIAGITAIIAGNKIVRYTRGDEDKVGYERWEEGGLLNQFKGEHTMRYESTNWEYPEMVEYLNEIDKEFNKPGLLLLKPEAYIYYALELAHANKFSSDALVEYLKRKFDFVKKK